MTAASQVRRRLRPARSALLLSGALIALSGAWIAVRANVSTDGAPVITDYAYKEGFTVDPLSSDPTPLRQDDVIVGIEGTSIDDALRGEHGALPPYRGGATWRYQVLRDGQIRDISVPLRDGDFVPRRLRDAAPILVIGVMLIGLGAWTVFRRPDHSAARALLILGAGFTTYNVFQTLSIDAAALPSARVLFAIGIAGAVGPLGIWVTAAAHLAVSFPEPIAPLRRRPWLPAVLYTVMFAGTAGLQGGAIAVGAASRQLLDAFYAAMEVTLYALVLVALAGLVRTIQRSIKDPVVRRQGALVALGMATTVIIVAAENIFAGDEQLPAWFAPVAFLPMPAAVAAAIVRGEFLDLRATINRALVFASLSGVLLGTYALVVLVVGALVGGSGIAATIPATGVVAITFAPLRSALQHAVDRIIYGHRGDPARVLTDLGRRLDAALPAEYVLPVVAETVATSLRLPYIGIRIAGDPSGRLACERGEPTEDVETIPLIRQGRPVGELLVAPRRGQRSLTGEDRAVLGDVARQIATAVDSSRLLTELVASRSRIAVAREEERAQLRHDLHDRLGSHLTGLSLQLDTLETRATDPSIADDARRAHAEAQRALEEVRRITRGLRPAELDELGLVAAIDAAATRLSVGDDGQWKVTVDAAVQLPEIPPSVASAAYHIVNEALTNARRHSGGTAAHVRVGVTATGSHLTVDVTDNGRGIEHHGGEGVGLRSMDARATAVGGVLDITAPTNGGATVRAELPLDRPDTDSGG